MARKLCTAGVRGRYTYLILDKADSATAIIHDTNDIVTTHVDMEVAERWVETQLATLIGRNYETD